MGCGISTYNLPSYMRVGRYHDTRKTRQLSWRVIEGDDDQKIPIIDHRNNFDSTGVDLHGNDDPSHDGKTSVSPAHVKNDSELENKNDTQNNGGINIHDHNDDPSHGGKTSVSPGHAKKDSEIDKGDENIKDAQNNGGINKERNNREGHEEENEVEEEYEREDNIDNLSWIGSPSFRDYCGNRHDSVEFDDKIDGEHMETETQGAATKPNEGSTERRRRSRFRKVFPVGKSSSAVKNILSVTTCYNPNHATSRIGQEK